MQTKLKQSLIYLILLITGISCASCGYNPSELLPAYIDTKTQTCRVYKVIKSRPTIEFEFLYSQPLEFCNGYLALSVQQALEIKNHYEWFINKKKKPVKSVQIYNSKRDYEASILSGVRNDGK